MACVLKCIPILHYLAYNYKKKRILRNTTNLTVYKLQHTINHLQ